MHVPAVFSIMLALIVTGNISYASLNTTCMMMVDWVLNRSHQVFDQFRARICDRGCKLTITHFYKRAEAVAVEPTIRTVTKNIGKPEHAKLFIDLAHITVGRIRSNCAIDLGKSRLCSD